MVDKSEKFSWLVRLGYAARGLLYIVIGYLALFSSHHDKSQRGAMAYVHDRMPGGVPLLYLIGAGLLAYALYKVCSLLFDIEHHGGEPKGLAIRFGQACGGGVYAALAWSAFQLANGYRKAEGSGGEAQRVSASLLSYAIGPLVLGAVGIGFFCAAAQQLRQAFTARFMHRISRRAPKAVAYLGRAGHGARAVVFAVVGWSLVRSAWFHHGVQIRSLGDALDALAGSGPLYTVVAVGLMLFGLFSLMVGYYRIIPDIDARDLKPHPS